ncbi:MAG: type I 3-dehydroquinate dehydratase [Bacteroidales bacterium]|nr:type I 3-dehydroquinate dehydratase [Bacteroidales bacterium]MDD4655724.1 type I 3-dehydroquinate dehydratase [Bacteroidales bacterium]
MICLSIGTPGLSKVTEALSKSQLAEIRLDLTNLNREETVTIFKTKKDLIATCRTYELSLEESEKRLMWAILGTRVKKGTGNRYIDLDFDSPEDYRTDLIWAARRVGFKIILSYHNFNETESLERLLEIYESCIKRGADIVKIVTNAKTIQECSRVLQLYSKTRKNTLVAFSIGDKGRFTRLVAHFLGSPFIYCTLNQDKATAPGQLNLTEAEKLISKKYYPNQVSKKQLVSKTMAPASKSHAQRAILAATWAKGKSTLYGYTPCSDSEAAISVIKKLGIKVKIEKSRLPKYKIEIKSPGIEELAIKLGKETKFGKPIKNIDLNVGESGLLCRLMIPAAGHLPKPNGLKSVTLKGKGSLNSRELFASNKPLQEIGIDVKTNQGMLPAKITGSLKSASLELSGKGGSQLLSGMLMALPLCDKTSRIELSEPTSIPYIDLTIKAIRDFGVIVENSDYREFKIPGKQKYKANNFIPIDGDWSGASMLMVGGAITNGITITNLSLNSKQADEKIIEVLEGCGVEVSITEYPKYLVMCGDIPCVFKEENNKEIILGSSIEIVKPKHPLLPFELDATNHPDLFPSLVVLALNCNGVSKIKGVQRLSNKESNRAESLLCEFTKLGATIEIDGDWMVVKGGKLHGGLCSSHNDHRIAMAIMTAALNIKEQVYVDNLDCISKSFPDFVKNFK